jgi:dienelactone hydrolase
MLASMITRIAGGCILTAALAAQAGIVEDKFMLPVKVVDGHDHEIQHSIMVSTFYDSDTPAPRPVIVINHGRAAAAMDRSKLGRAQYSVASKWLASMGFFVAVPTRIGYGVTGGPDVEDTGDCSRKYYPPGYAAAAAQTLQVLDSVRTRADVDRARAIVWGQSFGGATSITVASMNPANVQLAINFAGGGGGDPVGRPQDPCAQPMLKKLFADYGKTSRIPTLWIYTENDMYFGPRLPKVWFDAFVANGGKGEYTLFPPDGENGHSLFTHAPEKWQPRVLEFLRANGYPDLATE